MKRIIAIFLLSAVLVSSGCVNQSEGNSVANPEGSTAAYSGNVEKVEVFHFHGNQQCQGCINVGKCAEDAVNEYLQDEQGSGLVVFAHVNGDLPENTDLVQQYGATGSSLWIGVYDEDGSFSKEQNINVWYKTSDMEKCREYIKGVIEEKLQGE
jgi:hypothetical protein